MDQSGGGFWKSALLGGILALVIALCAVGGYVYFRDDIAARQPARSSRVAVVIASPGADDSTVAGLVALVSDGDVRDVSPDTSVTIPGTSFSRLGDAYAFAGASGVAGAIPGVESGDQLGWIDLPIESWQAMVDRSGGVTVTVPASIRVFDGTRLVSFSAGQQRLGGKDLAALLTGYTYLTPTQRTRLRVEIERGILRALSTETNPQALIQTNLGADDLKGWLLRLSQAPVEASGTVVP